MLKLQWERNGFVQECTLAAPWQSVKRDDLAKIIAEAFEGIQFGECSICPCRYKDDVVFIDGVATALEDLLNGKTFDYLFGMDPNVCVKALSELAHEVENGFVDLFKGEPTLYLILFVHKWLKDNDKISDCSISETDWVEDWARVHGDYEKAHKDL